MQGTALGGNGPSAIKSRTMGASLLFNPFEPRINIDPYPYYRRLREQEPVHWSKLGVWFVGRYADVRSVLKDRRFRARDVSGLLRDRDKLIEAHQICPNQPRNITQLLTSSTSWLAFKEGAEHKRLRAAYSGLLHRNYIELLRPYVREAATALIKAQWARGEMDLIKDFARHLPINVVARMIGIPASRLPLIETWARDLTRFVVSFTSIEDLASLDKASGEFMSFVRELLASQDVGAHRDLVAKLSSGLGTDQDALSEQELVSICIFIVVAGLEAVENLIGNGSLALLKHPDGQAQLRNHPEHLSSAIDELARYDTPLQMVMRAALEDVELGGKTIHAGDHVYLVLGSANRDEEQFADPDQLNLQRQPNHHLAFGHGAHLCVGAQLARLQAQEAIGALLETLPAIQLASAELRWGRNLLSRGLVSLPVKFAAHG